MGEEGKTMATQTNNNRNGVNYSVIVWPVVYLVLLVALPILRNVFASSIPHYVLYPLYSMPLSVLWFGALGGVMLSMYGIFFNKDWKGPFDLWYVFSGLLGAVYGIISYLIVVVLINSTTISNNFSRSALAFDLIAFLMGFGQNAFQDLIKHITGNVFGPGKTDN